MLRHSHRNVSIFDFFRVFHILIFLRAQTRKTKTQRQIPNFKTISSISQVSWPTISIPHVIPTRSKRHSRYFIVKKKSYHSPRRIILHPCSRNITLKNCIAYNRTVSNDDSPTMTLITFQLGVYLHSDLQRAHDKLRIAIVMYAYCEILKLLQNIETLENNNNLLCQMTQLFQYQKIQLIKSQLHYRLTGEKKQRWFSWNSSNSK